MVDNVNWNWPCGLLDFACTKDGSQQYFYIAEQVNDIHEKIYFVHDFVQGYPLQIAKLDRLQSSATQSEDDRGKEVEVYIHSTKSI